MDGNCRSAVAWSARDSHGRRHFIFAAFQNESWKGIASFFGRGGEISKFQIGDLQTDTVVWLDGGSSMELAYKLKRNNSIVRKDTDAPRAASFKYITDFIGAWWSPQP